VKNRSKEVEDRTSKRNLTPLNSSSLSLKLVSTNLFSQSLRIHRGGIRTWSSWRWTWTSNFKVCGHVEKFSQTTQDWARSFQKSWNHGH